MELNWSTFVLEIVNFLVLVWILKRFLYRPILDVIARRRSEIDKTLSDAKTTETNALALKQRYDSRLASWESEQRKAREQLAQDIDKERVSRIKDLEIVLEQERQKARVADDHRLDLLREQQERAALLLGARFAGRLLQSAAGPELENRLIELFLEELAQLSAAKLHALAGNGTLGPEAVLVTSAFELSAEQRHALTAALARAAGPDVPIRFDEDPSLLAGLRVTIGTSVLGLNLEDELADFTRLTDGDG